MFATQMADTSPAVRLATMADEESLVAMVKRMHDDKEWGLRDWDGVPFQFDEERTRFVIQRATVVNRNHPDAGASWIGCVGEPGYLLGSVCLHLEEPKLSKGQYLEMIWNWVLPEQRRSTVPHQLLNFALALADQHQRTLVSADRIYDNGGRARFMQRRIGRPVGSVFAYNRAAGTA